MFSYPDVSFGMSSSSPSSFFESFVKNAGFVELSLGLNRFIPPNKDFPGNENKLPIVEFWLLLLKIELAELEGP